MMKRLIMIICLLVSFSIPMAYAASDAYPFVNPEDTQRFQHLTEEIRCLVCQNQTIAESNATFAFEVRNEIYTKIQNGLNDHQIKKDLRERYGDYILFKPRFSSRTFVLWASPIGFLLLGLSLVFIRFRKQNRVANDEILMAD